MQGRTKAAQCNRLEWIKKGRKGNQSKLIDNNTQKLLIIVTFSLIVGIIVLGAIVSDMYGIVQKMDKRTADTQYSVNKTSTQVNNTITQLKQGQDAANQRGNLTLSKLADQSDQIIKVEHNIQTNLTRHRQVANFTRDQLANLINLESESANQSLYNQEHFFKPYFNKTFTEIYKRLDAIENKTR